MDYKSLYYINNQNDYSIDTYVNDSKNHIAKQNDRNQRFLTTKLRIQ